MTVNKLIFNPKKYKTALFRSRIIEHLRLRMVTEQQVLIELCISRTFEQAHQMKGDLGRKWRKANRRTTEKMQPNEIKLTIRNRD